MFFVAGNNNKNITAILNSYTDLNSILTIIIDHEGIYNSLQMTDLNVILKAN